MVCALMETIACTPMSRNARASTRERKLSDAMKDREDPLGHRDLMRGLSAFPLTL